METGEYCGSWEQCYSSIQDAIDNALAGYVIKIAAGTYPENLTVDKDVALELGWDIDFTTLELYDPIILEGP